jgi:hypothetical protein
MRDTTTIARPYFRESTDALSALVATRPARDVLLSVAAELSHRERPAARRLAATVAELLGGVSAIGQASEPVAIAPVAAPMVTVPCQVVSDYGRTDPGCFPGYVNGTREVPADHPAAIAHVAAKAPRKPSDAPIGTTARQRTAFRALSDELRAHLRAWDAWHSAWRAHRYHGGPNPGPEPVDTTSPEARARAERAARYEAAAAERAAQDAAHLEYWGGDLAARDKAVRSAPKGDMADPAHVAKVKAHMAAASKAARDAAEARNATRPKAFQRAPKAAPMARTTSAPSASASNRARAF